MPTLASAFSPFHHRASARIRYGRASAYLQSTAAGLRLVVRGELDIHSAPGLEATLRHTEHPLCALTVDLSGVTFVDCAGITPMLESTFRRAATEYPLQVCSTSAAVQRLVSLLDVRIGG